MEKIVKIYEDEFTETSKKARERVEPAASVFIFMNDMIFL